MTAGAPIGAHSSAGINLDNVQADRIARLFAEGHSATRIALIARCARARVLHVAAQRGWRLDAAGVLPRDQRPAVTPGRPVPAAPSGMGPAPARPGQQLPALPALPPPRPKPKPLRAAGTCREDGCTNPVRTMRVCSMHYMRARRAAS